MIGSPDFKWLGLAWFGGWGAWGWVGKRGVSFGLLLYRLYCWRGFAVKQSLLLERLYC